MNDQERQAERDLEHAKQLVKDAEREKRDAEKIERIEDGESA